MDTNKFREIVLERVTVFVSETANGEFLNSASVDMLKFFADKIIINLVAHVLSEKHKIQEETVEIPASWWQMFKRDCLPWKTKIKTRNITKTTNIYYYHPELSGGEYFKVHR
jgi:hypothetical protein